MGAIGEPKREIHIPVIEPAVPVPQPAPAPAPEPEPTSAPPPAAEPVGA